MASVATIVDALSAKFTNDEGQLVIPQDELLKALGTMKNTGRGRARKQKKEKDPDAPKRPTSAYLLWLNENRCAIRNEHFPANDDGEHCYPEGHTNAGEPLKGRDKVTLITKKAGALWKELDEDFKAPYQSKFEEASAAYKEAMGIYTPSEPKQKYDATEIPDAPEGWCGPFHKTYIPKVSKSPDNDKNFKSFKSFEDAVEAANALEEGCAGITKTSTGYSLRIGPEVRVNPEKDFNSGIASWVKGTDVPDFVESSPKSSPKLKKKAMPKVAETDEPDSAPKKVKKTTKKEVVGELIKVVDATKEEVKAKKATKKAKKVVVKAPTPEPESEDESEPELEVEEITVDGKDYYMDSNSGDIYDMETQEVVGKSEDGEHTIF
jgi:hypothetical protein